jgi:hypothetical protein
MMGRSFWTLVIDSSLRPDLTLPIVQVIAAHKSGGYPETILADGEHP